MEEKKSQVKYNRFHRCGNHFKDTLDGKACVVEGWVSDVKTLKEVGNGKKVKEIRLTSTIPDYKVKSFFGDGIINPAHKVFFKVSVWGSDAENLEKWMPTTPTDNTCVAVAINGIKIEQWERNDGSPAYTVEANATDAVERVFVRAKEGAADGAKPANKPADKPAEKKAAVADDEYEIIEGDDELPF